MVVEATMRNLRPCIRYGDRAVLDVWADDHLGNLDQARSTANHIWAIAADREMQSPQSVECLVVGTCTGLTILHEFRFDAHMLPVIDAGVAGWGWDDVRDLRHRSGRGATPAGLAGTQQRPETAFSEFAGRAEKQTRERMIAERAAGRVRLPGDDPTVVSLSYRIMRLPGLRCTDAHIEGSLRCESPFIDALVAAGCAGVGWADIADVLTDLELDVPEPFGIWCGLLVRRLWMCATTQIERQQRSSCGHCAAAGYEQVFAVACDGLRHGVNEASFRV